ncbi:MAG: hypothetical protein V1909_02375 [Candidatus Micrarchaeota archaeon]
MRALLLFSIVFILLIGCISTSKDSEKLLIDSAKKAKSLNSYTLEYKRVIASYANPNETVHLVPETTITKYKKGDNARWDTLDWLNNSARLYKLGNEYFSCSLNKTWICQATSQSKMQEFLGFSVNNPEISVSRAVSEGALLLGPVKNDTILGRASNCLAIEIYQEKFSKQDWDEFVLGSVGDNPNSMRNLKAWECLDSETGVKTELILNYKGEVDGEERTVEVNLKMSGFDQNPNLEDSLFELPRK